MLRSRRLRRDAESLFKDAHGNLLRFDDVFLIHGDLIGLPGLDPLAFRFRITVAGEELVHFSFRCHSSLNFECFCSEVSSVMSSADEEKASALVKSISQICSRKGFMLIREVSS